MKKQTGGKTNRTSTGDRTTSNRTTGKRSSNSRNGKTAGKTGDNRSGSTNKQTGSNRSGSANKQTGSNRSRTTNKQTGGNRTISVIGRTSNTTGQARSSQARRTTGQARSSQARRTTGQTSGWQGIKESNQAKQKRARQRRRRRLRAGILILIPILLVAGVVVLVHMAVLQLKDDHVRIVISGLDVSDMKREQADKALQKRYPWSMSVRFEDDVYQVDNLLQREIEITTRRAYEEKEKLVSEISAKSFRDRLHQEDITLTYELVVDDIREDVDWIAGTLSDQWSIPAVNASMSSFDAGKGTFVYTDTSPGRVVSAEEIYEELWNAIVGFDFQKEITVTAQTALPTASANDYRMIGTYTTTATDNSARNTNIRLACEAVNGMILAPGEQFSFNGVVGKRTAEKGYQPAGAYANGETVQEYGGGVCQVSSTLYNAVVAAGLQPDERTGHSYEPNYVTPGQDATVSYEYPDFKFSNNTEYSVGIRTFFENKIVRVEIYGVPSMEDGMKRYMYSEKTAETDPPAATYVEDASVGYGQEAVAKSGQKGSVWTTYIVTEKNGEVMDREYLHTTKYQGKAAVIRRNTTAPPPPAPEEGGEEGE